MIKKLVMVSCLALAVTGAYAQTTNTNTSGSNSTSVSGSNSANDSSNRTRVDVDAGSTSGSVSGSSSVSNGNTGVSQANIFTAPTETTATIKNVPSVNGPPLTTSNDTCMGSTSGSVNGPGFGIGLGTTWTDDNCLMLKNSRELWNMGMKAASMALMCTDHRTRKALEVTGFKCPNQLDGSPKVADAGGPATVATGEKYTDPIIRARLGLPPLATASK
jgi:hypothetical protein